MYNFRISEKKLIIIIAALSQLSAQLVANMALIALPEMATSLDLSATAQSWINIIYLISVVGLTVPLGKLIFQYGVRRSMILSVCLMIVSLAMTGLSFNFYILLASRLVQGMSVAALLITIYMIIVEEFDENEMGYALGIVASFGYIGLTIAPAVSSFVIYYGNWQYVFFAVIPLFILQLIVLLKIKSEWKGERQKMDFIGFMIYVLMFLLFIYGISELDEKSLAAIIVSFILLFIFIRYEDKHENPMLDLNVLRNVNFSIGTYAAFAAYFSTSIATYVLTYHLVYILNSKIYLVGLILLITPVVMIVFSIIAGRLSDRHDPRIISSFAMFVIFISMLMFCFVNRMPYILILITCAIQGVGHGLFSSPNNKYVLTLVNETRLPDASSVLATSKEFGKIVSLSVFTLILLMFIGDRQLGLNDVDHLLIVSSGHMMVITTVVTLSAAILLVYSIVFHDKVNLNLLKIFSQIKTRK